MKLTLDAVAIVAKNLDKALGFYRALGFDLQKYTDTDHYEAIEEN
jgi:catechol 2,3-dioxygenase-like lactoylglutathione lyase family enzyme